MSWQDRLRESAYTSPSGNRAVFAYEDVQKQVDKKTSSFTFPDTNGTLVQDLGHTGRRYPLRVIFWGEDYDLETNTFEEMLLEQGEGRLEHPIYGVVNVVPFGTITRRDDLKTAANQAVIEVTFWETIGVAYPAGTTDPVGEISTTLDEFKAASALQADNEINLESVIENTTATNDFQALLNQVKSGLQSVVDAKDEAQAALGAVAATAAAARASVASAQQQAAGVRQKFENSYASITAGLG